MRRILVGTDLGPASERAIARGRRLAAGDGGALRIVHAAPDPLDGQEKDAVEQALLASVGEAADTVSICIRSGGAATAILEEAKLFAADLIVLGNHGEPRLRDALFGTTASDVVQHATVPVLVAQNDAALGYRRILAAVDDDAMEAVVAGALAFGTAEQLFVVHAHVPTLGQVFAGGEPMEALRREHEARVRAAVGDAAVPELHVVTEDMDALKLIMREWEAIAPDLVVVGTHGRSGVARLLQASVAETVLIGCPSDVLVVPPPPTQPAT